MLVSSQGNDVVDDRTPTHLGELLEELVAPADGLNEPAPHLAQHAGESDKVLNRHRVGDHGRTVVVTLDALGTEDLRRPATTPRHHRLFEETAHLGPFLVGRGPTLGVLVSHHVGHQRSEGLVAQDVHALAGSLKAVQELGVGLPVPGHASLHRLERHSFIAGHSEHGAVSILGSAGSETESAVSNSDAGNPMPARDRTPRVPVDLRVIVGMQIDEAGRHDQPAGIKHLRRAVRRNPPRDSLNTAVLDADVGDVTPALQAIDDGAALEQGIELRHCTLPSRPHSYLAWQKLTRAPLETAGHVSRADDGIRTRSAGLGCGQDRATVGA